MIKISKFTAFRLFSVLMFPYSANAAAGCLNDMDYSQAFTPDYAYESVTYMVGEGAACPPDSVTGFSDGLQAATI